MVLSMKWWCILCAGTTLFWKGHEYGYMCIYMYLFVIEDFKDLLIKIIGYLLIFIPKKFEKVVSKKITIKKYF